MNKESETTLYAILGIMILSKYSVVPAVKEGAEALKRAGASLYDVLHNDEAHMQDLPGKGWSKGAVLALAKAVGFPDPKLATAIAFAESGGVPGAFLRSSREYSVGLWQINTLVHPYTVDEMKDPIKNARAAFKISKGGTNWRPWGAFTNGSYLKFRTGILAA